MELRIVFMGTPEFAVGILDSIIKKKYKVVGLITAADKPAGRGQKVQYSAVKQYALENNLTVLQPTNLKDEAFLADLKALNANLQIVVAFRMLPEVIWKMPSLGTFNLHASLLPNYRGAAPINWAIINGEQKTGVTTFFIDDKIDTGAMILSLETEISETENAGELHARLNELGQIAVADTLTKIENNTVTTTLQSEDQPINTANKLNKENCKIDWTKSPQEIYNLIRGLSPYPAAWTMLKNLDQEMAIKIYQAEIIRESHQIPVGTLLISKKQIKVAVKNGFIEILSFQFPGKKKMLTTEILNGQTFSADAMVY